jgi:hypothetical protein
MRTLKAIFDFYLDASIHVAVSVISMAGATFYLMGSSTDIYLLGFIFFSVIVCYNFIKYGVEAYKYIIVSNAYHKLIQVFSFLSFGMAILFLMRLDAKIWVATICLAVLSVLYAVPLLPRAKNLRNLAGLKVYIVAFVWAGFTVLLPVLDADMPLDWDFAVTFIQRMLLVLILILPFEIRDLQWDHKSLRTLPQLLGERNTRRLGTILSLVFFMITFLKDNLQSEEIALRLILVAILIFVLQMGKKMRSKYFVMFWIEAIPIFWLGLLWLSERYG